MKNKIVKALALGLTMTTIAMSGSVVAFAESETEVTEEAADADYVVILDSGKIVAKGTPLELKNCYTGDFVTIYGITKEQAECLKVPYEPIRDAYRFLVPDTKAATELIIKYPDIFIDYEITKGKMDDVFLAVTGKKLIGGAGNERA